MPQVIFADGTIYAKSKLNMINKCLLAIGEVPYPIGTLVDKLERGTDGDTARRIIEETMVEVQSIGWYFNIDYNFKLYKDIQDNIALPPNLIRIDGISSNRYMEKNNRLYDNEKQTYIIEPKYVEVDTVWLIDYAGLPAEAYEYIGARAARKFQEYVVGAPDLTSTTSRAEQETFVRLQRRQLQTRAYNIQNSRVSTRTHNGYLRGSLYGNKGRL